MVGRSVLGYWTYSSDLRKRLTVMVRRTHPLASPEDVLIYVLFVHTKEKHQAYIVNHFFRSIYEITWDILENMLLISCSASHQPNVEQERKTV